MVNSITLGMTSLKDGNGIKAIITLGQWREQSTLGVRNLELGIVNGSTLGGYFQIVDDIGSDT